MVIAMDYPFECNPSFYYISLLNSHFSIIFLLNVFEGDQKAVGMIYGGFEWVCEINGRLMLLWYKPGDAT